MARPAAMTAHLILTADTIRPLTAALDALGQESEARRVALLHDSGLVIAETGEDAHRDRGESGALAAGAFFAARQLATRLGDPSFAGLHYQGTTRDFVLSAAGPESLVLVVFDNRTRAAIVRACLSKHLPGIESAAARLRAPAVSPSAPSPAWLSEGPAFQESPAPSAAPDLAAVFYS